MTVEALDSAPHQDERPQITVKCYEPPSSIYSTNDEITFLRGLLTGSARSSNGVCCAKGWADKGANPEAFRRYARLVLSGMRTYGNNVDAERVRAEIIRLMQPPGPAPGSHPAVLEPDPELEPELEDNWDRTTDADYGPRARARRRQERMKLAV